MLKAEAVQLPPQGAVALAVFTLILGFFSFCPAWAASTSTPSVAPALTPTAVPRAKAFLGFPPTNGATPGFYSKDAPPLPDKGKKWDFGAGKKVQVILDPSITLKPVTPYSFGCNLAWYDGKDWLLDPDRIEKAKQAGIRFWRFPGGNSANDYYWDGNYKNHPKDEDGRDASLMNAPDKVSTDDFIEFCRKTGSEAMVTVNYSAARYDSVEAAADMAARWVRHFNVEKGFKVRYWEIGNENYGPWEMGNRVEGKPQLTGDAYGQDFNTIASAMRAVDPDIEIGAVIYQFDGGDEWTGHHFWTKKLLPEVKGQADFLIFPGYFLWPFDADTGKYFPPSNETLWGLLANAANDRRSVAEMVGKYSPEQKDIPVAFSEFNLLNATSPPVIDLVSGLYAAEALGEFVKTGYPAACFWDWKNAFDPKLRGDFGMLSTADPSVPDSTPRPSYYAFALYSRAFGSQMLQAQDSDPSVKVYASRFGKGELGLILVNEDGEDRTLVFSWGGFQPKGQFAAWMLTGNDLNGPRVSWNGVGGPGGGGGPFPIDSIEPYVGTFKPGQPFQLNLRGHSAAGIVIY